MRKLKYLFCFLMCFLFLGTFNVNAATITGSNITAAGITELSDLDSLSMNSGTIVGKNSVRNSDIYTIKCPVDGVYRFSFSHKPLIDHGSLINGLEFNLYSDSMCINAVNDVYTSFLWADDVDTKNVVIELSKGTYYLEVYNSAVSDYVGNLNIQYGFGVGYRTKAPYTYTKYFNESANTLTYTFTPNNDVTVIKVGEGFTSNYTNFWYAGETLTNNTYTFTKDGQYTIYTKDIYGHHDFEHITINDFSKITTPKLTSYKSGSKTIKGTTSANVTVKVTVGNKSYTAKSDSTGKFSIKLKSVLKVNNKITVVATSGTKKSDTLTVKVKNRTLTKPVVKTYKRNSKKITGTAIKGSTVYAKIKNKTYTAKVNSKGKYTIKVNKLKKGTSIKIYIKDSYGNKSTTVTKKVK